MGDPRKRNKIYQRTEVSLYHAVYQILRIRKDTICLKTEEICLVAGISKRTFLAHYRDPDELIQAGRKEAIEHLSAISNQALRFRFTAKEFWSDVLGYMANSRKNCEVFRIAIERKERFLWEEALTSLMPFLSRFLPESVKETESLYLMFCGLYWDVILRMLWQWGDGDFPDDEVEDYARKLTAITLQAERILEHPARQLLRLVSDSEQ